MNQARTVSGVGIPVTEIFIDDGCTAYGIMDDEFCSSKGIKTLPLSISIPLILADGAITSARITRKTEQLKLVIGGHVEFIWFYVTKLKYPITLGLKWLKFHKATITYGDLTVRLNNRSCLTAGHCTRPVEIVSSTVTPTISEEKPTKLLTTGVPQTNSNLSEDFSNWETVDINAVLTTHEYTASSIPLKDSGVPYLYETFEDVFSEKDEKLPLPPHRFYDMKILLDPEKTLPKPSKIYPISKNEELELKKYIDKALDRGWIVTADSNVPVAAPCFYVGKPNGGLRLCVDYRNLNEITIGDSFPVPIIQDIIDGLLGKELFTQLDYPDAYHLCRVAAGHEWKTTFRCKFGCFMYRVCSFGLKNCPAVFQRFMMQIFSELRAEGNLQVYIDNVLIATENDVDVHTAAVSKALEVIRDNNLYCSVKKCTFHVEKIDFMGFMVGKDGLELHPDKVKAILDWKTPMTTKELHSFLQFANFLRRFIAEFSNVTKPLSFLLKKGEKFVWNDEREERFLELKRRFASAPILKLYDFTKSCVVETDASDYALAGILSQFHDDILHPVAFNSRGMTPAEINYDIHDKELLAIIATFEKDRHYLLSVPQNEPIKVYSDHNNLVHFTKKQKLSRRQYRWAQFLSQFNFVIIHRPGRLNGKADALSRQAEYGLQDGDSRLERNYLRLFEHIGSDALEINAIEPTPFVQRIIDATKDSTILQEFKDGRLIDFMFEDGLLLNKEGLVVVPTEELQLEILEIRHNGIPAGHFGVAKTIELLQRDYYWDGLRRMVKKYIKGCDDCSRSKSSRHKPFGLLKPLQIPEDRWMGISVDFITDLPVCQGFDSICVFKDRLTKQAHLLPCTKTITAPGTAKLFIDQIFRLHGLPRTCVSDRGPQFVAKFWKRTLELLGMERLLTSGYHPESNGGTEVLNQVIEQYIRIFGSYQQDDWVDLLPLCEFAYNNTTNSSTGYTPFFANYGYHPRFDATIATRSEVPSAEDNVEQLSLVMENLKANLKEAQVSYSSFANVNRMEPPMFEIGDSVFLKSKDYKSNRPSKKLDYKNIGPFKIIERINEVAYRLKLPNTMKIHNVFHVSLLELKSKDIYPTQINPEPLPVIIGDEEEFEVESILDSKVKRKKVLYFCHWKGYGVKDRTWEPVTSFIDDEDLVSDVLLAFHRNYPDKPKAQEYVDLMRRDAASGGGS